MNEDALDKLLSINIDQYDEYIASDYRDRLPEAINRLAQLRAELATMQGETEEAKRVIEYYENIPDSEIEKMWLVSHPRPKGEKEG